MTNQFWGITPKTVLGKWSVGFAIAMPALFIIGASLTNSLYRSAPAGESLLADIATRPVLALVMLAGMFAGLSAFITGLLSILRQKENVLLVYISTAVGALLALFLIGEIISPH